MTSNPLDRSTGNVSVSTKNFFSTPIEIPVDKALCQEHRLRNFIHFYYPPSEIFKFYLCPQKILLTGSPPPLTKFQNFLDPLRKSRQQALTP